jgi:hypothetical protein
MALRHARRPPLGSSCGYEGNGTEDGVRRPSTSDESGRSAPRQSLVGAARFRRARSHGGAVSRRAEDADSSADGRHPARLGRTAWDPDPTSLPAEQSTFGMGVIRVPTAGEPRPAQVPRSLTSSLGPVKPRGWPSVGHRYRHRVPLQPPSLARPVCVGGSPGKGESECE